MSIQREGSCDALGVIAKGNISKGECVAVIPRSALLSCENSPIRDTVLEYQKLNGEDVSSWVPLLLALAAEYSSGVSVGSVEWRCFQKGLQHWRLLTPGD